jgi:hypothetical protein
MGVPSCAKRFNRKQLIGALTVGATVIGVLSSGTALFDWFGNEVNKATPPPAVIGSHLTRPQLISTHKSLKAFLSEINQPNSGLTANELAEEGFEFRVGVHIQGEQGKSSFLTWTVIDSATGNPLPESIYHQEAGRFEPRNQDQFRQVPVWVPSPPKRGKFMFRVTLLDHNRLPQDQTEVPFTVSTTPAG